jgi:hypothetical protein
MPCAAFVLLGVSGVKRIWVRGEICECCVVVSEIGVSIWLLCFLEAR